MMDILKGNKTSVPQPALEPVSRRLSTASCDVEVETNSISSATVTTSSIPRAVGVKTKR